MIRALSVSAGADQQIREAAQWWHENRTEAADLFHLELSRAFEVIVHQPGIGAPVDDPEIMGLRRIHLARIRYHLYYREREPNMVEVLAFWHTSRGSGPEML